MAGGPKNVFPRKARQSPPAAQAAVRESVNMLSKSARFRQHALANAPKMLGSPPGNHFRAFVRQFRSSRAAACAAGGNCWVFLWHFFRAARHALGMHFSFHFFRDSIPNRFRPPRAFATLHGRDALHVCEALMVTNITNRSSASSRSHTKRLCTEERASPGGATAHTRNLHKRKCTSSGLLGRSRPVPSSMVAVVVRVAPRANMQRRLRHRTSYVAYSQLRGAIAMWATKSVQRQPLRCMSKWT